MSKDDPLANIMSELEGGSRIAVPKRRVVSLPKPLVAPRGVVGAGLGTGNMNPRGDMSRRLLVDDGGVGLGQIESVRAQGQYMDEVDAYLEQKARASREVGGDDFYTRVRMQKNAHADLARDASFARQAPISIEGAFLGKTISLKAGEIVEVARWTGPDADTRPVTITLGAVEAPTPVGAFTGPAYRPYAKLQWGTGGYLVTAEIDIGIGNQFTINASSVILSVGLADNIAASSTPISITGMLSFQPCVRFQPITRTSIVSGIDLPAPLPLFGGKIPSFAKSFSFYRMLSSGMGGGGAMPATVLIYDYALNQIQACGRAATSGGATFDDPQEPFLLANDAQYFRVANGGGSQIDVRVVWNLEL